MSTSSTGGARASGVAQDDRGEGEAGNTSVAVASHSAPVAANGSGPSGPPPRRPPALNPEPEVHRPPKGWGLPLLVLIVGMFMSILDTSIVNVAIPVIQKQFGVSTESIQWISTSYTLTEGVIVPMSAWLGARVGLKRLYIWSLVLFTVASALCGLSGDLGTMIFFRIMQAIPGGLIPVTCLTLVYRLVPRERIGAAMGLYGLGVVVAPGIGPTLGGYFVEYVDWRLIFYINVPIGILGALAAVVVLAKVPAEPDKPFDFIGFFCIAGSLFSLLLALEEGSSWGWTSYPVLILFAVAVNLMVLFVVVELQIKHPLLNIRIFAYWPFVNSLLLVSALSIGFFAELFYIPLFLQNAQGLTPWNTGLTLLPQAMTMMVLMPLAGQLYDRFGARWPAIIGLSLTGTGLLMLSRINIDISRPELIAGMMVMAAGLGLAFMPIMTGGLSTLPAATSDSGSTVNTLVQRVSSAFGLALMTAMVTANQAQFMADRSALLQSNGADADPRIVAMQAQGPSGLIPLWQQLTLQVQAQTYSNSFFIAGCVTLSGVVLALFLRRGAPATGAEKPMVH
ncbi:MAG TPA: DHA2 family efflux MFS transporter permease subunit [Pseudonocardia sp.]|jgi:EmrB/QacA subfamily drug resistance transporter|uniref:DHA2 family efflux MFS transporter permease subunit n=1 Tax=Pseudonocardia sp. TaxID=60912 RepID=UPI002CACFBB9|nr:DHA2 family efflux MFS transporter permease subunit [Pseudonocardia sp.]HTF53312.1 DHA2 family efflux MFS transporter permease subunit [Pseudonocardia sp.]